MENLLKVIKMVCVGFPVVTPLEDHYTGASHRIFAAFDGGIVAMYWYEKTGELKFKNHKWSEKLKATGMMG